MKPLFVAAALLLSFSAFAQDYIVVQVEAENFTQKNALWRVFSNSSQPNVNPDPDATHHNSASGRSYLELLPDTRVTHGDPLRTGNNFWPTGGQGPSISYTVNFPEPGRYIVWAKAYSTGTEDNGIHVGINGNNPESGQRIQWCSGKNNWTWSSAQRASNNHCGTARTIYLDVPFAGANTIAFSAREDGFELDQFMLIKEKAAGLQCAPANNDSVSCNRNASGTTSNNNQNTNNNSHQNPEPPATQITTPAITPGASTAAPAAEAYAQCHQSNSDSDGDGYGWENGMTCIATGTSSAAMQEFPICSSANTDSDGDGWGWENNQSCLVPTTPAADSTPADSLQTPYCVSAASDPDGDGWGWENNQSCIVQ